jgi:hypothetical protein
MKLQNISLILIETVEDNSFDIARPKVTREFVKAMQQRKDSIRHEAKSIERYLQHTVLKMPHFKPWNYPCGEAKAYIDVRNGITMRIDLIYYFDESYLVPINERTLPDVQVIRDKLSRISNLRTMEKQLKTKIARDQRTLKLRASQRVA